MPSFVPSISSPDRIIARLKAAFCGCVDRPFREFPRVCCLDGFALWDELFRRDARLGSRGAHAGYSCRLELSPLSVHCRAQRSNPSHH